MITIRIEVGEDETRQAMVQVVNTEDSAVAFLVVEPGGYEDIDLEAGWHIEVEHDEIGS